MFTRSVLAACFFTTCHGVHSLSLVVFGCRELFPLLHLSSVTFALSFPLSLCLILSLSAFHYRVESMLMRLSCLIQQCTYNNVLASPPSQQLRYVSLFLFSPVLVCILHFLAFSLFISPFSHHFCALSPSLFRSTAWSPCFCVWPEHRTTY